MIAENAKLFFLEKADSNFKATDLVDEQAAPKFADKLLYSSECRNAKRYYIRPLHIDFKVRLSNYYEAKSLYGNDKEEQFYDLFAAEGEFTMGLNAAATYFTGLVVDKASKKQTFEEIRLVMEGVTYRFQKCWIRGIQFYYGCGMSRETMIDLKDGGGPNHTIPMPLAVVRFNAEEAHWSMIQTDKQGKVKGSVYRDFKCEYSLSKDAQ